MALYYNTTEIVYLRNVLEKDRLQANGTNEDLHSDIKFHEILERIAQGAIEVVTVRGRLVS